MLVLSRKQGQSIELPELDIAIQVVAVKGSRVQLGVEAPREFTISRPENPLPPLEETESVTNPEESEISRIRDELARVEGTIAALAEMTTPDDRTEARRMAAESVKRLQGIRRTMLIMSRVQDSEPRPLGELVKVRTEVLDRLRRRQASPSTSTNLVRQSSAPYCVA